MHSRTVFSTLFLAALAACGGASEGNAPATGPAPAPAPAPVVVGQWVDVTPSNVDMTNLLNCGNYGVMSVQADPLQPSDLYAQFNCQGIWKSVDYGKTWIGPINTGRNGKVVADCAGAITVTKGGTPGQPVMYQSCIRGDAIWVGGFAFWKSSNGGVDWTGYHVLPSGSNEQFYQPVADPYDANHLLMAGHASSTIHESLDAGLTWTNLSLDPGMNNGGTWAVSFIDMGNAAGTRKTMLALAQHTGGLAGTWRTEDGGAHWTRVDSNEHAPGRTQTFQPDTSGVLYMGGAYSGLGWGVLRSTDFGKHWAHVGVMANVSTVFGTPKYVYATNGGTSVGLGGTLDPSLELAAQPGTGPWTQPGTPAAMKEGPGIVAVTNDGKNNILLGATGGAGLWRYIEP